MQNTIVHYWSEENIFILYLCEYDTGTIKQVEKEMENKNRSVFKEKSSKYWSNYCIKSVRQTEVLCCVSLFRLEMW